MKGKAIVLLLVVACAVLLGVPRYGYRVDKAQLMEGMALTFQFKAALAQHFAAHGSFLGLKHESLPGTREGEYVEAIAFSSGRSDNVTVTANFRETALFGQFGGKTFSIATLDGGRTWKCIMPVIHIGFFTPTSDLLQTLKPCN